MIKKSSIAFIGGRGAGKSKISRKFGKVSERVTLSTDTLISYEANGKNISKIVEDSGWPSFRDQEFAILVKLANMPNIVVDCGGGILVEAPENEDALETFSERKAKLLKSFCHVVYVKRDMDWLLKKSIKDVNRPDLVGPYVDLLERRLPWYENTADYTLNMDEKGVIDAVDILIDKFPLD